MAPPAVPASFWATDALADAFSAHHMGRVCRAYRQHSFHAAVYGKSGIPQALVAQWLGISQAQVNRVEKGDPPKNLDMLIHWAVTLRIPQDLLWFDLPGRKRGKAASVNHLFEPSENDFDDPRMRLTSGDWDAPRNQELAELIQHGGSLQITADTVRHLVHEWLIVEPPQIVELASGRHIGDGLVTKVERRVAELRRTDDFMAGGDLHEVVERELSATAGLLRDAAYSEALGRRLLVAVGELCQLAGWVSGDAGNYPIAAHYYSIGVKAAHAAADAPLAGNLISTLSYQVSNVGNPSAAVLLAQTAVAGAKQKATATTNALFKERVAWAHAKAGDVRQTERALSAVESDYEYRRPDDDPEWVYWLNENEIDVMAGRCYVELGFPQRAESLLSAVLARYDTRMTRELALYTSWLAEAQISLGNIDEAASTATKSLELTSKIASARSDDRVKLLRQKFKKYLNVPSVADFEAQVHELGAH